MLLLSAILNNPESEKRALFKQYCLRYVQKICNKLHYLCIYNRQNIYY